VLAQVRLVRRSLERFVAMDGFNRSMALAAQAFTTLIPLLIIVAAVAEAGDGKNLGDRIIELIGLSGASAASLRRALPPTGTVQDSLSVLSVVILVISALSFTRALQRMYARAWGLEAHGLRDAPWGLTWLAGFSLYAVLHPLLHDDGIGRDRRDALADGSRVHGRRARSRARRTASRRPDASSLR
jgi:membrane protein